MCFSVGQMRRKVSHDDSGAGGVIVEVESEDAGGVEATTALQVHVQGDLSTFVHSAIVLLVAPVRGR